MRISVFFLGLVLAGAAQAHVGHLGEFAGHDHWLAAGAIGIALGVAGWNALKGRKDKDAEDEIEAEGDETPQEA